ncbi:MAG: hypothetical protein VB046_07445 [Paludibacter sp.]|nr:hypothetical protein [Paludibacter sp.]
MKIIDKSPDQIKISLEIEYNHYVKDSIDYLLKVIDTNVDSIKTVERPTPTGPMDPEMWFKLIVESPFIQYVVENITWDILKWVVLSRFINPFLEVVKKIEDNKKVLIIGCFDFQFDDVIIKIGGLSYSKFYIVSSVFSEIANNINMMNDKCHDKIVKIETPIFRDPYSSSIFKYKLYTNEPYYTPTDDSYLRIWKVWLSENRFIFYDVKAHDFVDEDKLVL